MEVLIVPFHIQYLKLNNSNENKSNIQNKILSFEDNCLKEFIGGKKYLRLIFHV